MSFDTTLRPARRSNKDFMVFWVKLCYSTSFRVLNSRFFKNQACQFICSKILRQGIEIMLPYCPVNCFVLTQCNYFLPPSLYYVSTYCYAMISQDTGECELTYHVSFDGTFPFAQQAAFIRPVDLLQTLQSKYPCDSFEILALMSPRERLGQT